MNPFVLFLALLSVTAGCASGATHPVTVTITSRTERGDPVPQVPLGVTTGISAGFGLTGTDGVLVLTLEADDATFQGVSARLYSDFRRDDVQHLRGTAMLRYNELREQYYFDVAYVQPADPSATGVSVTVIAYPAVTVTGTIRLGPAPAPSNVIARVGGGLYWAILKTDVEVTIKGVRRGADATLYFGADDGQVFTRNLTAAQTQSDCMLGEIVLTRQPCDAHLKLTVTNRNVLDERTMSLDSSVCLVRLDGQVVFSRAVHTDGRAIAGYLDGQPTFLVPIPAGTYFVIPGSQGSPQHKTLVAMVAASNLAALDAANVPKLQLIAGQTLEATVDATKAYVAIKMAKP